MKGAAWATPVVMASTAAPAFAASGNVSVAYTSCTTETYTYTYARLLFTVTVTNIGIPAGTAFEMIATDHRLALGAWSGSLDHYDGTLKPYLNFVSGDMECAAGPCTEHLASKTLIPPGTYTLSVAIAVEFSPTTIRFVVAPVAGESTTADNFVDRPVYRVGGFTSCAIP